MIKVPTIIYTYIQINIWKLRFQTQIQINILNIKVEIRTSNMDIQYQNDDMNYMQKCHNVPSSNSEPSPFLQPFFRKQFKTRVSTCWGREKTQRQGGEFRNLAKPHYVMGSIRTSQPSLILALQQLTVISVNKLSFLEHWW